MRWVRRVLLTITFAAGVLDSQAFCAAVRIGPGAYFREPGEFASSAGKSAPLQATPFVGARLQLSPFSSSRFGFEPALGCLFPFSTADGAVQLESMVNVDFTYLIWNRLKVLTGPGVQAGFLFSRGREIEVNGTFYTPASRSTDALLTGNGGLAFDLDDRLRIEGEVFLARPFNQSARKLHFGLAVNYAI